MSEKELPQSASMQTGLPEAVEPIEPVKIDGAIESTHLSGLRLWIVMAGVVLPIFLSLLDTSIITTAIPKITTEFNSLQDVGWYGSGYMIANAVCQPLAGKIYVNFHTKRTFLTFFFIFEVGSLVCGTATSSSMLIVGRAIAGIGSSGLQNGAFQVISTISPLHKQPSLIGIGQGCSQLGVVFGPLIGGALTQYTTWRWCFYINLQLGGLVAALLVFTNIPESGKKKEKPFIVIRQLHKRLDLLGFVLFASAMAMLLLAIQWGGNKFEWDSPTVLGLLAGGFPGMMLIWLVWNWKRGDEALIPFSMLRKTIVWSSCVFFACLMSAMFIANYYLPIYFQAVDNASPIMSGVYMLPSVLSLIVAAVLAGRLVSRVGYYVPFCWVSAMLTSLGYGFSSTLGPHSPSGHWIGWQILFGAGRGLGVQMPIVAVQHALLPGQAPLGVALCMFSGILGGALSVSFSATIFTNSLRSFVPKYAPSVDAQAIISAGATGFRGILSPAELRDVLIAYSKSLSGLWYLAASLAAASSVAAWGLGWKDIRKKEEPENKI